MSNANNVWLAVSSPRSRSAEYIEYTSLKEALDDFNEWVGDYPEVLGCTLYYKCTPMIVSRMKEIKGGLCEQYNPNCLVRSKLPDQSELENCAKCIENMMKVYVK